MATSHFVYIVKCADGTLYTGWTLDVERRVKQHNAGRGARYTRTRRPVQLIYVEAVENRRIAMQREIQIKRLNRASKTRLINSETNQIAAHQGTEESIS